MKIIAITTIAQHYKNPEIHIKNLMWALSNYEYKIIIQTYKKHNLKSKIKNFKNIEIKEVDEDPNVFYHFWNESNKIFEQYLKETDFFLFIEQDIFFVKKPIINPQDSIVINLASDYLSVYDSNKIKLYPRIWEGATFINKEIIKTAINDNVHFGDCCESFKKNIYKSCGEYFTFSLKSQFKSFKEISDRCLLDTLLEFSFYCFLRKYKYRIENNNFEYEYGDFVVHLRGIDMMCHDNPKIYFDISEVFNLMNSNEAWKRLSSGCAFLLLLNGTYEKSKILKKIIKNNFQNVDKILLKKIDLLVENSACWLEKEEINKLFWAKYVLENKIIYI